MCMKIILVVSDGNGKNVVFVTDTLHAYSLDEAVQLARDGKFEGVYAVSGKHGAYLRTRPRVSKKEELETLAVSPHQLFMFANNIGAAFMNVALEQYLQLHELALTRKEAQPFIAINSIARISKKIAREKLGECKEDILQATKRFKVDPYLLGAILIDEIARFAPIEGPLEKLGVSYVGRDVSAGIAQVTMETARGLIKDGYYNPNPDDPKFSHSNIDKVSRKDLYEYVQQQKHSIFFGAAHMRALIDHWKRFVNLNRRPEIIATLYSIGRGKDPHGNPQPSTRGMQIAGEFYKLAREWLS